MPMQLGAWIPVDGIGVIVRDCHANFIAAEAKVDLCNSALIVQAKALLSGLDLGHQPQLSYICIIESDSQVLVTEIQSSKCRNWTIYPLIAVIRHRSLNFAGVHWSWISYEGNYASHGVASLANLRVGRQRWANRPPPSILHVLSFDGLPYLSSLTLEAS